MNWRTNRDIQSFMRGMSVETANYPSNDLYDVSREMIASHSNGSTQVSYTSIVTLIPVSPPPRRGINPLLNISSWYKTKHSHPKPPSCSAGKETTAHRRCLERISRSIASWWGDSYLYIVFLHRNMRDSRTRRGKTRARVIIIPFVSLPRRRRWAWPPGSTRGRCAGERRVKPGERPGKGKPLQASHSRQATHNARTRETVRALLGHTGVSRGPALIQDTPRGKKLLRSDIHGYLQS